jgi:hypothetical protein
VKFQIWCTTAQTPFHSCTLAIISNTPFLNIIHNFSQSQLFLLLLWLPLMAHSRARNLFTASLSLHCPPRLLTSNQVVRGLCLPPLYCLSTVSFSGSSPSLPLTWATAGASNHSTLLHAKSTWQLSLSCHLSQLWPSPHKSAYVLLPLGDFWLPPPHQFQFSPGTPPTQHQLLYLLFIIATGLKK